jgi:predicted O-methyltransferase YrrM
MSEVNVAKEKTSKIAEPQNMYRQQIAVPEQKVVLRGLTQSCARQGMLGLEVGSWCGDSAVEIGAIVKGFGGKLFCVDWWKGNIDTHLEEAAKQADVYSEFWNRIVGEGLDDVIIPIRGRSDDVAKVLRPETFDMIYIDGDHRYSQAKRDIEHYSNLVKDGGIFCGDDCEGWLSDFTPEFLATGKEVDFHETVHCGVVLSVGESFEQYSINYNIWSVRRHASGWLPTNLQFENITPQRQCHPPLLESYKEYNIVRYGKELFAVHWTLGTVDITQEADRKQDAILSADSVRAVRELIDKTEPPLLPSYKKYNLVRYGKKVFALPWSLGTIDITKEADRKRAGILSADSIEAVHKQIDRQ